MLWFNSTLSHGIGQITPQSYRSCALAETPVCESGVVEAILNINNTPMDF